MRIIIDTRERKPLEFIHPYITEVTYEKLSVGDYACIFSDGFSPPIRFERKTIPDLFGTLGKGYRRFKREINCAIKEKILLIIIIEGTFTQLLRGYNYSQKCGDEICQQLFTLTVRYRVPFVCCKDSIEMQRFILEFFLACGREHLKENHE